MIEQQIQALELLVKENLELAQKNLKQALNRLANNVHCNNAMQNYDNHFRNGSFWFEMNQKILMFSHNLQYISLRTEEQLRYTLDGLELLRQSIEFNMKKN